MRGALIVVCVLLVVWLIDEHSAESTAESHIVVPPSAIGTAEDPLKRFNYELKLQVDPRTGDIPPYIHKKEKEFVRSIPAVEELNSRERSRVKAENWTLTGPFNVGGRTRALALDVRNENVIVAGGVSGGMWRSTDTGLTWVRSSHPSVINSTTCVAQDIRSGREDTWYHGTGELRGGSAKEEGAPHRGDGIFKSLDGGVSWDLLPSTTNGRVNVFNSPFNYVWNIALNHQRSDADEIYAAVYGGIVRSVDGGGSWTTVLGDDLLNIADDVDLNDSGASFFTDVIITPSGVLYAALSTFTSTDEVTVNKGIFRSTDGTTWQNITPGGMVRNFRRIVMNYAPSNENVLYAMIDAETPQLWKYDNGQWRNRTTSIPNFPENLGPYDSQQSYNMMVTVHPVDENVVYLGGTNLYRSSDGFISPTNTTWIGGYDQEKDNGSVYPGHHPDQHALVFFPSDADKAISANDGGLMISNNMRDPSVSWFSVNNGYITSQFYSIGLAKDDQSNRIIGGMQDNGSYVRSAPGENVAWTRVLGGDGGYVATTPGNLFWYVSFQEGRTFRLTLNDQFGLTSFARVDPQDAQDFQFITPYILDPNNYNRMYMAAGDAVWRNDNLSQVPAGSQNPTGVNWNKLSITSINQKVSALDVSTNISGRLYFAVEGGTVFRLDGADTNDQQRTQIFNTQGYVVNITVDPSNADNVLILYSNYNIPSVYYTSDGGQTVQDVSGNLEEFPDGTGSGPSTRWSEIIPLADGSYKYFVGTSTGLYSTTTLDGANTMWAKESVDLIGDAVVRMMDYRDSDGKLVVATHGNGVFETSIATPKPITKASASVDDFVLTTAYPNPFSDRIQIEFEIPEQGLVRVDIINAAGEIVDRLLYSEQFAGKVKIGWDGTNPTGVQVRDGVYFYRIMYNNTIRTGRVIYDKIR